MRVLMLDEGVGAGGLVEDDLIDAGHEVVRCHPWGQSAFPCVGLLDRRQCPLEQAPIAAAVKVSGAASTCPGHHEEGVLCAVQRRVPLVLAGSDPDVDLIGVASAVTIGFDDVVGVVEGLVDADIADLSAAARATALGVLENHGLPSVDIDSKVTRRDEGLAVRLRTDEPVPAAIREIAAIKVHATLKQMAPDARSLSVAVIDD